MKRTFRAVATIRFLDCLKHEISHVLMSDWPGRKSVNFEMSLSVSPLKAKFEPKTMIYDGEPDVSVNASTGPA